MQVSFGYPLAGDLIAVTPAEPEDEECEFHSGVGTSADPASDSEYLAALTPSDRFAIDQESAAAEQTFTFPHFYSNDIEGDQVQLKDEVVVKIDRIPHLGPPPKEWESAPPTPIGPTTPIAPPTKAEEPPVIPQPEIEADPPVITGGGPPTKLRTGITAKCPKAAKRCTVTGIVEAELPARRPAGNASASRAVRVRRIVLGRISFPLAAGKSKRVSIALSKAGVAFLRAHPGVRAKILVTVSAPGAAKASSTRSAKLHLPAPRKHM
jgi:hypothetical protein